MYIFNNIIIILLQSVQHNVWCTHPKLLYTFYTMYTINYGVKNGLNTLWILMEHVNFAGKLGFVPKFRIQCTNQVMCTHKVRCTQPKRSTTSICVHVK